MMLMYSDLMGLTFGFRFGIDGSPHPIRMNNRIEVFGANNFLSFKTIQRKAGW
jgi:hypothetical protein